MDGYITRVADEIADILVREGIDYGQSKAVFKAARSNAGLRAPKERRAAPARLTLEEQLRFIDAAYARSGQTGLMVQTLLETGTRVSEFVALRVEDVGLGERTITVESGKGAKRREIPIRAELARLLSMHIGTRRAGPLFLSRQKGTSGSRTYTRQRIGQMVRHYIDCMTMSGNHATETILVRDYSFVGERVGPITRHSLGRATGY